MIRTAEKLLTPEADGRRIHLNRPFLVVWLVMMGLMSAFRWDIHWPMGYLIMFGCFYLTDYSREAREELFRGTLEGIILGFLGDVFLLGDSYLPLILLGIGFFFFGHVLYIINFIISGKISLTFI